MRQRGPGNGQDLAEIEERERRSEDRDPLGRSDGNYGDAVDTGVDKVPLELERQRSREILDELRRRAGEQRPKDELDYAQRVWQHFYPGLQSVPVPVSKENFNLYGASTTPTLVLVDRKRTRDLPIAPDYVGKYVDTVSSQRVLVELEAQGHKYNKIWLINKDTE